MPFADVAVRKAAIAELRGTLAAIRSATGLLCDGCLAQPSRTVVTTITRATARAERAVERLERHLGREEAPE
jgi:hypothetical protein